jgi:hypothetical protein
VPQFRMKVAPDTVAYADRENHKLAWIPTEEECPNENASALPENPGIFAISASWSLCGSKSYMGGRREVTIVIINYAFGDH